MTPRRFTRRRVGILLGIFVLPLAIGLIALALLLTWDWNKARPWLNEKTSEAMGRPFRIAGDLSLTWKAQDGAMPDHDKTWRDAIPWPHLVARDIHIGNPADMPAGPATAPVSVVTSDASTPTAGDMASVKEFSFSLNPLALLDKRIAIPALRFDSPVVQLQRAADGRNNWTFKQAEKPSSWKLELDRIIFSKGVVHLADALQKANITATIDTIDPLTDETAGFAYGIAWKLRGTFQGDPISGSGKAGAVLSLQHQTAPYPLAAGLRFGGTRVSVEGTLTRPTDLLAVDMRLKLAAPSMARLYTLTGIVLPETPPFSTEGHLIGKLGKQGSQWTYDKFTGKVGGSDIGGTLAYQAHRQDGQQRGLLTGDVVSRLLQFSDLGPLIGADSNASKAVRGVAPVQPAGKVLPAEPFKTARWTSVDADVKFAAGRIVRDKQLPIDKLSVTLHLRDGVVTLSPLTFGIAGGTLNAEIKLDGSGRTGKNAIRAEAKVSARHLRIGALFPGTDALKESEGEINGDAQLSATGMSVATLLAASNGEIKILVNQGTISKLLLEKMGLNIANVVLTQLAGDRQIKLNCLAADFAVTNGLMHARSFVVDTAEAIINVSGDINLASEQLDLTLRPDTRGLRVFSLRAPLYVHGTFGKPGVSVDKGVLAMRAGSAIALAALAPIAALLPLVNTGPGENSECGKLLASARIKPVAPAPGKTSLP
ncbi:AsmA family protein [Noviherbaspirillum sp.]|uniref:AsmA family protein n=1 Tax=Noviherbaspirillum sp. TaxID=1926288 RepID=UPI002FE0C72A